MEACKFQKLKGFPSQFQDDPYAELLIILIDNQY